MKRFLIVCAMALAATVICHTPAHAWHNFYLNNNFSVGCQSGGNRFLWGLWNGGAYPAVQTPCGYSTYPSPYDQYHCLMQQRLAMQQYYQMGYPYGMCPQMGYGYGYGMNPQMGCGYGMNPQMGYGMMPQGYGQGYGGMNNFWAPGMAMYGQGMGGMQGMQQGMQLPQYQQMPQGVPGQQTSMPAVGNAMGAAPMPQMGGYPMMMMPPPQMYYAGPPVQMPIQAQQGPQMAPQLVPHMPPAQDGQVSGPPLNAQQIGYAWQSPFCVQGPTPSYWTNP